MLDKQGYIHVCARTRLRPGAQATTYTHTHTHTHTKICNIFAFHGTMVSRTRLSVTLCLVCLSCSQGVYVSCCHHSTDTLMCQPRCIILHFDNTSLSLPEGFNLNKTLHVCRIHLRKSVRKHGLQCIHSGSLFLLWWVWWLQSRCDFQYISALTRIVHI